MIILLNGPGVEFSKLAIKRQYFLMWPGSVLVLLGSDIPWTLLSDEQLSVHCLLLSVLALNDFPKIENTPGQQLASFHSHLHNPH